MDDKRGAAARIVRIVLVVAVLIVAVVVMIAMTLSMHRRASDEWAEFSIGPATGMSASIDSRTMVRSDGITLKAAVALAYDVPAVRVMGPVELLETRYAINAVLGDRVTQSFRSLLQEELKNRLRLETHTEPRPFEVFVLTATDSPALEPADGLRERVWIRDRTATLEDASMENLANALQGILGRPVIDATGIDGLYDLEFGWDENRVSSVTAVLRDRFGLQLAEGRREMRALIVDRIQRDPSLVVLEQISRVIGVAPAHLRQRIGTAIHIH
jgi:uncharacterized protein (TIGR03435 family)